MTTCQSLTPTSGFHLVESGGPASHCGRQSSGHHICPCANTETLCTWPHGHRLAGSERGHGPGVPVWARCNHENPSEWEEAAERRPA